MRPIILKVSKYLIFLATSLVSKPMAEAKETDSQMLEQMIQATAGLGDAQVSAILMDARHKKMGAQSGDKPKPRVRTFEL